MKIGILTYYGVHNHGAVLQANALKTVLEEEGNSVEFLTFKRNYDCIHSQNEKKYNISLASTKFYFNYLLKNGIFNILYNIKKRNTLSDYRKKNIFLGQRYSDYQGDAVVIGSDEVFSFEVGINPFFFGHGLKVPKIISYAGCFGPTTAEDLKKNNLVGLVSSGLEQMNQVGVRDENSQSIANALGSKPAVLVCDPVILYGYKQEQNIHVPVKEKYILVYAYDRNMNDEAEVAAIKKYAADKELKVYSVGYYHKWCHKNINVTPNELLGYVKNAEMVITDTFHGAVLSIVCNTQFVVRLRENSNKLGFLLKEYGLESRIMDTFDNLPQITRDPIDFLKVNLIVEEKRRLSMNYLRSSLTEKEL